MKVTIEAGEEIKEALGAALLSGFAELSESIEEMKLDLKEMQEEAQKVRKGLKHSFDPEAYRAFFDEVSTASRLHLDRMRKYLHEMWELKCQTPGTSTMTEQTPPTSSDPKDQKDRP